MHYLDVEEAQQKPGLKLALTARFPGPWCEAAKSVFYAKGLDFVPVRQLAGKPNEALFSWSGHRNAPVAMYGDEPAKTTAEQIVLLAERLAPSPQLVPDDVEQRALMFGLIRELSGELGLGWSRRAMMLNSVAAKNTEAKPANLLMRDYSHGFASQEQAVQRTVSILQAFSTRLREQQRAGKRYLCGDSLTALDIYWATFAILLKPLPSELCDLPEVIRPAYENYPPEVRSAADDILFEHRDYVYQRYLQLPMDF